MAEHMLKKYIAKVEKTVYVVEEIEIIAETERQAEEILDEYCCEGTTANSELVDVETQESVVDHSWTIPDLLRTMLVPIRRNIKTNKY